MSSLFEPPPARSDLLDLLRKKSVFYGDFTLTSGAKSRYYVDCKLTTYDPRGAWMVGHLMRSLIRSEEARRGLQVEAVGGLTMGADPLAVSIALASFLAKDQIPLQAFSVRKSPKKHGQTKLIEGNFVKGQMVVVLDDVITRGESTLAALQAITQEGGRVGFVASLVDRQEGGRERIEAMGYPVVSLFRRDELLGEHRANE